MRIKKFENQPTKILKDYLDGATAHTDKGSMRMVSSIFGHENVISLRTKIFLREFQPESSDYTIWAPSSPDLNCCDYWAMVYE